MPLPGSARVLHAGRADCLAGEEGGAERGESEEREARRCGRSAGETVNRRWLLTVFRLSTFEGFPHTRSSIGKGSFPVHFFRVCFLYIGEVDKSKHPNSKKAIDH